MGLISRVSSRTYRPDFPNLKMPINPEQIKNALNNASNADSHELIHGMLEKCRHLFNKSCKIDNLDKSISNKLYTENCDNEQIWQQIDIQQRKNFERIDKFREEVKEMVGGMKEIGSEDEMSENEEEMSENGENGEKDEFEDFGDGDNTLFENGSDPEDGDVMTDSEDEEILKGVKSIRTKVEKQKKFKTHALNEGFFNIHEMHHFLDKMEQSDEDAEENSDDEEDMEDFDLFKDPEGDMDDNDMMGDVDDDDDGAPIFMKDFEPENVPYTKMDKEVDVEKYINNDEPEEEEDDDSVHPDSDGSCEGEDYATIFGGKMDENKKSTAEKRRFRQDKGVTDLEESNLAGHHVWQLGGETEAKDRPQNSLLAEALDFDTLAKTAPIITDEYTNDLEDVIKSRVRDLLFDDVERKVKPREDPYEYRKKLTLNAEKSKMSLADIYENDYLKKLNPEDDGVAEADTEMHLKIKQKMSELFYKLDHLSNHTFVPRPAMPEVQIISNRKTVKVEEAGPLNLDLGTGGDSLLAPEEVSKKSKLDNNLLSREERTKTDKLRELRIKKKRQAARGAEEIEQTGFKKSGAKVKKASVSVKNQRLTSTKFFSAMETEKVMGPIKADKKKKKADSEKKARIEKLKL